MFLGNLYFVELTIVYLTIAVALILVVIHSFLRVYLQLKSTSSRWDPIPGVFRKLNFSLREENNESKHNHLIKMSQITHSGLRSVSRVIKGQKMMEGAGVRICRTIGANGIRVDPYLMLDELKLPASEATAGFPDHPHRGFETCSIMLSGKIEHHDSVGNHGVIGPGGVQWMTAGRGW